MFKLKEALEKEKEELEAVAFDIDIFLMDPAGDIVRQDDLEPVVFIIYDREFFAFGEDMDIRIGDARAAAHVKFLGGDFHDFLWPLRDGWLFCIVLGL